MTNAHCAMHWRPQSTSSGYASGTVVEATPISWTERVNDQGEEPLWARGWINKERYEHETGESSLKGHGLWRLEILDLAAQRGYVVTIDATPTTYDLRSHGWVFASRLHTLSAGQLQRVAAITGSPPDQSQGTLLWFACACTAHSSAHQDSGSACDSVGRME